MVNFPNIESPCISLNGESYAHMREKLYSGYQQSLWALKPLRPFGKSRSVKSVNLPTPEKMFWSHLYDVMEELEPMSLCGLLSSDASSHHNAALQLVRSDAPMCHFNTFLWLNLE